MNWGDLTLVLPLPPSNNDLVRPCVVGGKARLVSTLEAKMFRAEAVHAIRTFAAKHRKPERLNGPVLITAVFFVPTLASDCNNRWKALEDAITESQVVWDDDKQVSRGISEKAFASPVAGPMCWVRVEPRTNAEHARRLLEAGLRKPKGKRSKYELASANYRGHT